MLLLEGRLVVATISAHGRGSRPVRRPRGSKRSLPVVRHPGQIVGAVGMTTMVADMAVAVVAGMEVVVMVVATTQARQLVVQLRGSKTAAVEALRLGSSKVGLADMEVVRRGSSKRRPLLLPTTSHRRRRLVIFRLLRHQLRGRPTIAKQKTTTEWQGNELEWLFESGGDVLLTESSEIDVFFY